MPIYASISLVGRVMVVAPTPEAIEVYKWMVIHPELKLGVFFRELHAVLSDVEADEHVRRYGVVKCMHCGTEFESRADLRNHVRYIFELDSVEARDKIRAWYPPNLILK